LMAREHGKCQLCGKEFKGKSSHIHHIIPKSHGGTDREANLALLHENCHKKLHKNKLLNLKKNKQYKDASFMNTVRCRYQKIFNCPIIYGYETFAKRILLKLEKTHYNDAFIIAGGTNQIRTIPMFLGQKHKNSRILQVNRKGFKPAIKKKRYSIRPYDLITVNNKKYVVKGCHCCGRLVTCENEKKFIDINVKKIEKIFHTNTLYLIQNDNRN